MVLGWCGVQATLNAMLAAVTATVPDQVPSRSAGPVGGLLAIAQTIGVVAGTGIAAADRQHRGRLPAPSRPWWSLLTRAVRSRHPRPRAAARLRAGRSRCGSSCVASGSRRARYPDFAWAWLTRFLVNLGNSLGTLYLLYYLHGRGGAQQDAGPDGLRADRALRRDLVATTVVFGAWSDRLGRRKMFVDLVGRGGGLRPR